MPSTAGTELKRALVSSKVNSSGSRSRKQRTLPSEVQQLKERLEDELRAAVEQWVQRTTQDGAELDDEWAGRLAEGARLLEIDIADCAAAVRAAYTERLALPQDSIEELRRAWELAGAGIRALGGALAIDVAEALGYIDSQLNAVADSLPEMEVTQWREWLKRLLRDWQRQGEAFRKGGTEPSLQAAIDARAEWLFSTKIFAKADAAGRGSGSDTGDAGDGEWQSADGASDGEASGAETDGEEAEGEEAEGETGPPLWAEYDALDDLSYHELWAAHQQEFPNFCFWHVCGGCSRGSMCRFEHGGWPEGYQDMCYSVTGIWPE